MESASQLTHAPSGAQWTIDADGHHAVVVEVGGGLRTYRAGGVEVIDGYAEDELCPGGAGHVLAPWPNRIRDGRYTFQGEVYQLSLTEPARHNAIHGLANWARWQRVAGTDSSITLEHELVPQPGYPWPLVLRTTWTVGAGGLTASHEVTNLGERPAPFGIAAHPYLYVPGVRVDDLLLRVPARNRLLVDSRMLPIGAARVSASAGAGSSGTAGEYDFTEPRRIAGAVLDTAFGDVEPAADGRSVVTVSTVDGRGVSVWADEAFGWWQIYTGDTLPPGRARRSIAVEPMTCPPDAFRSGRDVIVIEPGKTWQGAWGITPTSAN
jgi:aldose 1-epimerase